MVLFLIRNADVFWREICTIQMDWANNKKKDKMSRCLI